MTDAAPAKRQRVEGGERNLLVSRQDGARSSINVSAAEVGRESIASPAANQLSMWSAYCAGAAEPSLVDHYRHGGNEMEVKDVGGVEDVEEVAEEERAGPEPEWVTAPNEAQAAELEMLGLSIGVRLEVQWELELEGETHSVWWGCKLCGAYVRLPPGDAATAAAAGSQTEQSWRVLYDEKPEHGFAEEVRRVVFSKEYRQLVDKAEEDTPMAWKPEGEIDLEMLPAGSRVKARWNGGETFHTGRVEAVGEGGYAVYTIRYDDGSVERGVRPELVQPTDGVLPCADDIVGIDKFWSVFVAVGVSPILNRLLPDKQLLVAEVIAATKPDFVAAVEALQSRRGFGAAIDDNDIREHILPVIMPKVVDHAQRVMQNI